MVVSVRTLAILGSLAAPAVLAQSPDLQVQGGSMPGALELSMGPGAPGGACAILTGVTPGPTPLSLFDPGDLRVVNLGTQILGNSFLGLFLPPTNRFTVPTIPVPNLPNLVDAPFYFQGITYPGLTTIVNQITVPRVVRLAPPGAFRDRGVQFTTERAFPLMLPRADGSWMLVGGGLGALLAQIAERTTEIYDPLTDSFRFGPTMTTERSLHTATRLQDGRWLVVGGVNVNNDPQASAEIYDPTTDTFSAVTSMTFARMGHSATLLPDGRVLVAGGLNDMNTQPTQLQPIFSALDNTEIYDPTANSWTAGPALRTPRAGHMAFTRPDNSVVLAGGISFDVIIIISIPALRSSVDIYTPSATGGIGSIAGGPRMNDSRALTEPADMGGGRFLLAGGISSLTLANQGTPTDTAEIYDSTANTWTRTATNMATARGIQAVIPLGNGRFLNVGGANGDILNPVPLASTEIYDANLDTWTLGPPLTRPRTGFGTFLTPTGQVHVCGGGTAQGVVSKATEWYYF